MLPLELVSKLGEPVERLGIPLVTWFEVRRYNEPLGFAEAKGGE